MAFYSNLNTQIRPYLAGTILACFIIFFLTSGIHDEASGWTDLLHKPDFPDFGQFKRLETLPSEQFPHDDSKRIIAIGDIHGMNDSLHLLLSEVSYDPQQDTLIHLGDIITKGPVKGSLAVLSYLSANKVKGVRGNNDQKVIEWRAWMDWILSLPGGEEWLIQKDKNWPKHRNFYDSMYLGHDDAVDDAANKHWGDRVPKGWAPLNKHYKVARAMSRDHYNYLLSLPLIIYAPAGHTYFVHAGLLPSDPHYRPTHPSQPLSHWPQMLQSEPDVEVLRGLQELAILKDVPQNNDPYIVTNIRGVKKSNKITKSSSKGTPWAEIWNDIMGRCKGLDAVQGRSVSPSQFANFHVEFEANKGGSRPLPCYPSTIVYAHAATRGLDIKRWSVGLDSGCTYGRRLSAIILDKNSFNASSSTFTPDSPTDESVPVHSHHIPYGDNGQARILSVRCR
ncbi:Metallo-dependent phosphatase-like protein [Hygrophoropsis aurantiaca]|uniref:Metallo-dependent phosphatase-like protein n=1 Tax=Hygrophoropsis aurantiaca TaxID=72124 RepID=A0ACB8AQR2_9AGAM|nr:Metallo-dependent phosphatase-like protein [Hygrophoropsis aurantiaca]